MAYRRRCNDAGIHAIVDFGDDYHERHLAMTRTDGPLASNAELHRYLLQTAELVSRLGLTDQANKLRRAAAHGTGLSTEFLGESTIALKEVLRVSGNLMDAVDRDRLVAILEQLETALKRDSPRNV